MNVKDLKKHDYIQVYSRNHRKWGRGIVARTYTSGGLPGARVIGFTEDDEQFDIHIKDNSAIGEVYYSAGQKVQRGRHEVVS